MKRVIGYMVLSALGMASEASEGDIESVAERLIIQTLEKQYLIDQENIKNRQVKVEKVEAFQGEHAADFTISVDISYDNYNSLGYTATTRERRQYTVGLEQVEGVWQIIDYRYINPFVPQKTIEPNKTKTATELELKPLHLDENADPHSYNDVLTSVYNRYAAVNYAKQYVFNYNPSYRVFSGAGGDCTNFTSQSLRYGGWEDDGSVDRTDVSNWFYHSLYQSYTWVNAHYFAVFHQNSGRSTNVTSTCDIKLGDIISADWDQDGELDHTMIVTQIDSANSCLPYLTYHSTDTLNKSMVLMPTDADYYGWHVNYNENP